MDQKFSVTIPAMFEKSDGDEWRVYGLASTGNRDLQGEVMDLKGLDLSPIEKGRGVFNIDHKKGMENIVGAIDAFKKTDDGLYLGGYLFKNHDRAKAVYQIMSSLKKTDVGRMGMSVEGVIKQRAGDDGKIIKKAVITSCALTMAPVNEDTYVNLVKSLSGVEFDCEDLSDTMSAPSVASATPAVTFTSDQVVALLEKALGVTAAAATTIPAERTGGDVLVKEDLDEKLKEQAAPTEDKPKKKLKKMDAAMCKSRIDELLTQLQKLHPEIPRAVIWESVKDRLNRRFDLDSEVPEKILNS